MQVLIEAKGLMLEFGVGSSRNWDPRRAGEEATVAALNNLSREARFLLVFSTIHYYRKYGKKGLQVLLENVKDSVSQPNRVPLIGGTVAGFITPTHCATRGVAVVAGTGDVEAAAAHARGVRRSPISRGRKVVTDLKYKINRGLHKQEEIIIGITPGPRGSWITNEQIQQFLRYFPDQVVYAARDVLVPIVRIIFNQAQALEEEILHGMQTLDDYLLIGLSAFDDLRALDNFQYYNTQVFDDTVVALVLRIRNNALIESVVPLLPMQKKFFAKLGCGRFSIDYIDGKPAFDEYLHLMNWPSIRRKSIAQLMQTTFYYPLGYKKDGETFAFPVGSFFGRSIVTNRKIQDENLEIFLTSSQQVLQQVDNKLKLVESPSFLFNVQCAIILGVFGKRIFIFKRKFDKLDCPYITVFGGGEFYKQPKQDAKFYNFGLIFLFTLT